tara:strand:- start:7001 stop:7720 length:720 start_codon:yes stop_codon:yes gene_type:complete
MNKYLIKYSLEFIVIVTGITLSFWINEWNNNRMNREKEIFFLNGLKSDLEIQINSFKNYDNFSKRTIDLGASILEDYTQYQSFSKTDSLNFKLSRLMYSSSYPSINTTFNELKSTGQFTLFKDKILASKIIKYYQDSENYNIRITKNTDIVYYNQIFPIIRSSTIIDPNNFGFNNKKINMIGLEKLIATILNNSEKEFELVNAIGLRIVVARTNQSYIITMIKEAEALITMINNELSKN